MLPPMEQNSKEAGSGGYHSPWAAAAFFISALMTPGWTTAVAVSVSMCTSRIRWVDSTRHPSIALAPPDNPLPRPRVTTGTRWRSAQRSAVETRSEEHTSELQSRGHLVCRLLLEKT